MTNDDKDLRLEIRRLEYRLNTALGKHPETPKKSIFEILQSFSGLITGALIAGVGAYATFQYKTTQTKLAQLEALDKYRSYLTARDPQQRTFGYEAFVALGQEEFVARLIRVRKDVAGDDLLQHLVKYGSNENVRKEAKKSLLSLPEERRIMALVNIFEYGDPDFRYGNVTVLPGDPGHLTYGAAQTTLSSGNLFILIKSYISKPGAASRDELLPYLGRLERKDLSLGADLNFQSILVQAGDDPAMRREQDNFFRKIYLDPAKRIAERIGIKSVLGIAVVYDSRIHGSFHSLRDQTTEELGGTPASGIDEKTWIKTYLKKRIHWLENHSNKLLHRTSYRVKELLKLAEGGNWDLIPPFNVLGRIVAK